MKIDVPPGRIILSGANDPVDCDIAIGFGRAGLADGFARSDRSPVGHGEGPGRCGDRPIFGAGAVGEQSLGGMVDDIGATGEIGLRRAAQIQRAGIASAALEKVAHILDAAGSGTKQPG